MNVPVKLWIMNLTGTLLGTKQIRHKRPSVQIHNFIYPNFKVHGKQTTLTCVCLHLTREERWHTNAALFSLQWNWGPKQKLSHSYAHWACWAYWHKQTKEETFLPVWPYREHKKGLKNIHSIMLQWRDDTTICFR